MIRARMGHGKTGIAALLLAACAAPATATEPLSDVVAIDGMRGRLFKTHSPGFDLPPNDTLRAMRIKESACSARGGPVGSYRIDNNQLVLVELWRCGGAFPVRDVYPAMQAPALATWISGELTAVMGSPLCHQADGIPLYQRTVRFTVDAGIVKTMASQSHTQDECPSHKP